MILSTPPSHPGSSGLLVTTPGLFVQSGQEGEEREGTEALRAGHGHQEEASKPQQSALTPLVSLPSPPLLRETTPMMLFRDSTFLHDHLPCRFNFFLVGPLKLQRFTTFLLESPGRPCPSCLLSSLHSRPTGLILNSALSVHLLGFWLESSFCSSVFQVGNTGALNTADLCPAAFGAY